MQLPVDIRDSSILAHDPLPPLDSRETYERPDRDRHRQGNDSFFGAFLRSLLPTYDPVCGFAFGRSESFLGSCKWERPEGGFVEGIFWSRTVP